MAATCGYAPGVPTFGYDFQTPPRPSGTGDRAYYSPRQFTFSPTPPPKGHTRRATETAFTYSYSNTTPRKSTTYTAATPQHRTPAYNTSAQSTPQRRSDYVSGSDRRRKGDRYHYRQPLYDDKERKHSSSKQYSASRSQFVYDDYGDFECEYLPRYEQYEPRPPPYARRQNCYERRADPRYYDQVPIYTAAEPAERPRLRRASYTEQQPAPRPRTSHASKPPPQATADDARRAGIPAGYSYKNWDPTEEPILLLGSVFDANSLGRWIYDWTVFYYGRATPMSEVAGELWLLLIQLAGKIKRAEDTMSKIRCTASRDLVDDFLDSGERLWQRFNKLLKICENYMWKAAKKESGGAKKVTMGKNSGCEFVDSMFGRDRELERTEKLMSGLRLWSLRFDANCEEILRNPGA